jgi:hypothetical protein
VRGIGVAVITSTSVACPLAPSRTRSAHAEPVLFVDDGQPQIGEGDVLLEHRMGAHEDLDVARRQRRSFAARSAPLSRPVRISMTTPAASASGLRLA